MDESLYSISEDYINWLKGEEGLEFKPYDAGEGGTPTIGYGHKLSKEEIKSGKVYGFSLKDIDKDAAETILRADIASKQESLDKKLTSKYNISLSELDPTRREMLLDYEFNVKGGINKFPAFTKAVLADDIETARKEYVRKVQDPKTNKMIPLGRRNKNFFDRYLNRESLLSSNDVTSPLGSGMVTLAELLGQTGTGLENELLGRSDLYT